jgi:thioredoxin-like negative regulator of GroEL
MPNSEIKDLDDSNWESNVEKGSKPVFVMFYSPTCAFCKQMEPYFYEYSNDFKGKVIFARVNVVKNPTIISRYGIMGTPTFKYFCKGRPIQEISGAIYHTLLKKTVEDGLRHGDNCEKNTSWIEDPGYV